MSRLALSFPDGSMKYCDFGFDNQGAYFMMTGSRFTLEDMIKSNATAVTNSPETLRQIHALGLPVRPTPQQTKLSISLNPDVYERLNAAVEADGRSRSAVIVEIITKWLDSQQK